MYNNNITIAQFLYRICNLDKRKFSITSDRNVPVHGKIHWKNAFTRGSRQVKFLVNSYSTLPTSSQNYLSFIPNQTNTEGSFISTLKERLNFPFAEPTWGILILVWMFPEVLFLLFPSEVSVSLLVGKVHWLSPKIHHQVSFGRRVCRSYQVLSGTDHTLGRRLCFFPAER